MFAEPCWSWADVLATHHGSQNKHITTLFAVTDYAHLYSIIHYRQCCNIVLQNDRTITGNVDRLRARWSSSWSSEGRWRVCVPLVQRAAGMVWVSAFLVFAVVVVTVLVLVVVVVVVVVGELLLLWSRARHRSVVVCGRAINPPDQQPLKGK